MLKMRVVLLSFVLLGLFAAAAWPQEGSLVGVVDPPMLSLAPNQRAGVTYLIQNLTARQIVLRYSGAAFFVGRDRQFVESRTLPINLTVPAGSVAAFQSDVSISESIAQAARAAQTDEVFMTRYFRDRPDSQTSVGIDIRIRITGSLAGAVSVNEILLDVPQDSKMVAQFGEIRAHAFIRGTGTGAVVGTWFVDDMPVETFQINMIAGLTQEVSTRRSLPTLDLGEHEVQLRITRPAPQVSNSRRYVVVPADLATQRVMLVSPRPDAALSPDATRLSYRWAPMPGASGYEIAFASDLGALGLDANGAITRGPLGRLIWKTSGALSLFVTVPGDVVVWRPTPEDYARIFSGPGRTRYWAVRAIYPGQEHGDPTTTAKARRLILLPAPAPLVLSSPAEGTTIDTPYPTFEWEAGPPGSVYELTIMRDDRPVFSALTSETQYALSDLLAFRLTPGHYSWRVAAIKPGEGVVAASETRGFVASYRVGAAPRGCPNPTNQVALLAAGGVFVPLPAADDQIAFTPADGAAISEQQPQIGATYPEAQLEKVALTLDGVDVTGLADITPTSLFFKPPRLLSPGEHSLGIALITTDGTKLEATSKFTVELPAGEEAAAPAPSEPDTEQGQPSQDLELQLESSWQGNSETTTEDTLSVDTNLRGQKRWQWGQDAYSALNFQLSRPSEQDVDITNFLIESGFQNDRYKARLGDVGTSESPLTITGLSSRAFNLISNAGPVRLSATHTVGSLIGRSSTGRAPDIFVVSAENAKATTERGVKLIYVNSKDEMAGGGSGFSGPAQSRVLSFTGRTPIAKTGISLQGEFAHSNGTFKSVLDEIETSGNALTLAATGKALGADLTASYRKIASEFASPASTTLTNDLRGWELQASRPLARFVSATASYTRLKNAASSTTPYSSVTSWSWGTDLTYPNWPSLRLEIARNVAAGDPAPGGTPSKNEENLWAAKASYGKTKWNADVGYSRSNFKDFYDVVDPATDVPNDNTLGDWTAGFGYQPTTKWRFRIDWDSNSTRRWFEDPLTSLIDEGIDGSGNFRFETECRPSERMSATLTWARSKSEEALGFSDASSREVGAKLNYYLTTGPGSGRFVLSAGWRFTKSSGSSPSASKQIYTILLNDSRLFSF